MSRPARIVRNIAIGLGALLLFVVVAALIVVHTGWFRETVRQRIIASTEEATGGKACASSVSVQP